MKEARPTTIRATLVTGALSIHSQCVKTARMDGCREEEDLTETTGSENQHLFKKESESFKKKKNTTNYYLNF